MCPAYHDYMHLVNQRGGVEGYKIKADEINVSTRYRRQLRPTDVKRRKAQSPSSSMARR